jgi:adenine deaminase
VANNRTELIDAAMGRRPLDLAIRNVNLVNVFTCEIYAADIGVYDERIAVVGPAGAYDLEAVRVIDGTGRWATPGFVDTHLHIESTMVTPAHYAAGVLPFGTTTSIIDPHEIANVLGMDGVRYMIEASEGLPLRIYITVPSCVPAVPGKETAGADFGPEAIAEMLTWPRVIGVAEVMDYMGVVNGSPRMVEIVQAGLDAGVTIQGHSPLLRGRAANAYLAAGIENDHELRAGDEGLEKLRLGVLPLLKVSSHGNHVPNILPTLKNAAFLDVALCTDDIEPADLLENGHMDRVIREMIAHDIEPAVAIRWATLNGARNNRLRDHGALAPGYLADIVLLDSLVEVTASDVFVGGRQVVTEGALCVAIEEPAANMAVANSVRIATPLREDNFCVHPPVHEGNVSANILVLEKSRLTRREVIELPVRAGRVRLEELDDVCTITIVPRHGQPHAPRSALLKGLGLRRGALASSIGHDSHNILVTGHDPADMLQAVEELEACGGGLVVVVGGDVLAKVELPLAGLMSRRSVADLAVETRRLNQIIQELGVDHAAKGLSTTGLALTVIPELRMSDLGGLFDVASQEFVPVFVGLSEGNE